MEIAKTIGIYLLSLLCSGILYYIKDLPNLTRELKIEDKRSENQKNLQREAYFREISGTNVDNLIKSWVNALADMQKFVDNNTPEVFLKLQTQTMMYGSEKTVEILSEMMQYMYNPKEQGENSSEFSIDAAIGFYFIASLISSLKYDFTGYKVDPLDLIETRIKDINVGLAKINMEKGREFVEEKIKYYKK